jgi:hypothetical protein
MKHLFLLIALVTLASVAVAQVVVTSSGQATTPGPAVVPTPVSPPLLVAPQVYLGGPLPQVGATNATEGNTAGAANATGQIPSPPTTPAMVPEINMGEGTVYTIPVPLATSSPVMNLGVTGSAGTSEAPAMAERFELGVRAPESGTGLDGRSLGEIAREYRQREQNMQARVYTNEDINRMASASGGMAGVAAAAAAAPPSANNGAVNNAPAVAAPAGVSPIPGGVAQPVSPPPQPQAQPSTPPPAAAQNQTGTQEGQLPHSASFLPLVAVVGFLATAIGLLSR